MCVYVRILRDVPAYIIYNNIYYDVYMKPENDRAEKIYRDDSDADRI